MANLKVSQFTKGIPTVRPVMCAYGFRNASGAREQYATATKPWRHLVGSGAGAALCALYVLYFPSFG